MSLVRHEVQQYATPAALTAEVVAPTNNDEVHVESLNRRFNWLEGSSSVADNQYIIEQTSESANGRWAATAVEGAKVFTGTGATGDIPNGNTAVFTVTMTGTGTLAANSGAALGITNGGTFPANVFLDSIVLTADNTVQLTVVNESGADVAGFNVDVKAIDYTGVASPTASKRVDFGSVVNNNTKNLVITFTTPFASKPFVTLTAIGNGSRVSDFFFDSLSNTGFTLKRGYSFSGGGLQDVEWKAEEK